MTTRAEHVLSISSIVQGVLLILWFSRIFIILRPLPRQHCVAINCTENGQPIRVTMNVHSDIRFDELVSTCRGYELKTQ